MKMGIMKIATTLLILLGVTQVRAQGWNYNIPNDLIGQTLYIQNLNHQNYIGLNTGSNRAYVTSNPETNQEFKIFKVDENQGKYSIQHVNSKQWLSTPTDNYVSGTSRNGGDETFTFTIDGNKKVCIKSSKGKFLSATSDQDLLQANFCGPNEAFTLMAKPVIPINPLPGNQYSTQNVFLQGKSQKKNIGFNPNSNYAYVVVRYMDWEVQKLVPVRGGRPGYYGIQNVNSGMYLSTQTRDHVTGSNSLGTNEQFYFEYNVENQGWCIKTSQNTYLSIPMGSDVLQRDWCQTQEYIAIIPQDQAPKTPSPRTLPLGQIYLKNNEVKLNIQVDPETYTMTLSNDNQELEALQLIPVPGSDKYYIKNIYTGMYLATPNSNQVVVENAKSVNAEFEIIEKDNMFYCIKGSQNKFLTSRINGNLQQVTYCDGWEKWLMQSKNSRAQVKGYRI